MIGVIAENPDGVQEKMTISQWQEVEKLGYKFVRTYSEPSPNTSTEKTYTQPTISQTKAALPAKKKGCGCGK
jgi:hypothetical protein